jgi:hypothetical protein
MKSGYKKWQLKQKSKNPKLKFSRKKKREPRERFTYNGKGVQDLRRDVLAAQTDVATVQRCYGAT